MTPSASMMTGPSPFFTVVIPTFNRARYVERAICSVLDQSFQDFELIVVDDGSTDGTRGVLQRFTSITTLEQPNRGVSAARNLGVSAARGKWLAFLDSDDEWHSSYLDVQHHYIAEGPPAVIQCTDCFIRSGNVQPARYFEINGTDRMLGGRSAVLLTEPFSFALEHTPWQIGSSVAASAAFHRAGGFDESLTISEDLDLIARLCALGSFRVIREPLVNVIRRDELTSSLSLSADRDQLRKRQTHDRIYNKLSGIESLTWRHRRVLRQVRSANQRAMGNLLRQGGNSDAASKAFWSAFCLAPSPRSLGKLILNALPVLWPKTR